MRDFWTFKPKEVAENKRYLFECKDAASPTGSSLFVKVAATHSGVVNQNHRFYRPDRMQDAAHQWVPEEGKGYAKPVLFEHDKVGDVLGRVRSSRYIDESYKWAGDFPTIKDSLFYKVGDKKVDLFKSVDWIVDNLMGIPDYSGLGYIELGLNVTNPDAISKVLRDEFLTVSVGFQTDSAICSVCHTDWAKDDKCDHHPGERDEDSKRSMFLICGDFKYEEISFVNFPADPFAGKVAKDAIKDSINRKFFMGLSHDKQQAFVQAAGMSMSDAKMDYDIQLVEEHVATAYDLNKSESRTAFEAELKDEKLVAARALELKQVLLEWKPTAETDKTSKRSLMSTLNAKIKKNNWVGVDATATTKVDEVDDELAAAIADPTPNIDEVDWSKFELTDEDKAYFSDEDGLYTELCLEMDAAVKAGELTEADVKDAKLNSEQRKKLATGTFCGPGRSFPVPDCAHVVAARRLIGKYKGTGSKSAILSCVARKASSLGCSGKKADTNPQVSTSSDTIQESNDVKDSITALNLEMTDGPAKQAVDHYNALDKVYKSADDKCKGSIRMLHFDVGQKWSTDSALEWSKKYLLENEKDSVIISSKDLADKEEAINTLTDEVATKTAEVDAAKAQSQAMLLGIKKSLATQIVIYKSMSGHADYKDLTKEALAAKVDELSKRHVTSLKDAVADIMSELKWKESTPAPPTDKVVEPGNSVADTAQVDPAVAITDSTASNGAPEVETEAEKFKKQQAADLALREKLASMTPRERRTYMADLAYSNAKAVIKS
jgi:hypothetical protein